MGRKCKTRKDGPPKGVFGIKARPPACSAEPRLAPDRAIHRIYGS
jgi:hypothetical protein